MSIEPTAVKHERTESNYGILLVDGTLLDADMGYPWNTGSANAARAKIFDEVSTMRKARIPESMWPRVVKVKRTITYHDIEELDGEE